MIYFLSRSLSSGHWTWQSIYRCRKSCSSGAYFSHGVHYAYWKCFKDERRQWPCGACSPSPPLPDIFAQVRMKFGSSWTNSSHQITGVLLLGRVVLRLSHWDLRCLYAVSTPYCCCYWSETTTQPTFWYAPSTSFVSQQSDPKQELLVFQHELWTFGNYRQRYFPCQAAAQTSFALAASTSLNFA